MRQARPPAAGENLLPETSAGDGVAAAGSGDVIEKRNPMRAARALLQLTGAGKICIVDSRWLMMLI